MIRVTCSFVYLAKLYKVHIGPIIQCHVRPVTKRSNDDDDDDDDGGGGGGGDDDGGGGGGGGDDDDDDDAKEVSSRAIQYTE